MIAYNDTIKNFYNDISRNTIRERILSGLNHRVGESEMRSWENSLSAVCNALHNVDLPDDVEVGIELKVPLTQMRVDFVLAGVDGKNQINIVIVELKQWDKVKHTDKSEIVEVGNQDHVHPSWQAYTYGSTINSFNQYITDNNIGIHTCTFLHNYKREYEEEINNKVYKNAIELAPPFIKDQYEAFAKFINKYISKAARSKILFEIDNGKIKPTKALTDAIGNMLNGNKEYELLQDQIIVHSNLYHDIVSNHKLDGKDVFIVRGGAGTGKSVIAIQLLADLINKKGYKTFYVSKSTYVRENYFNKLTRNIPNYTFLKTLFLSSSKFIDSKKNEFDVLIVDEAHRLTKMSKMSWMYKGNNQIDEIINASKASVFFIDETQNIDIKDYGTIENIIESAKSHNARVHIDDKYILKSQFRCNGSDEYIHWLDCILYNKEYLKSDILVDYDIKLFDHIEELFGEIVKKNNCENVPARMLSGDVFPWISRTDPSKIDIIIDNFRAQWNRTKSFATSKDSINEVGCIHTSQ